MKGNLFILVFLRLRIKSFHFVITDANINIYF